MQRCCQEGKKNLIFNSHSSGASKEIKLTQRINTARGHKNTIIDSEILFFTPMKKKNEAVCIEDWENIPEISSIKP